MGNYYQHSLVELNMKTSIIILTLLSALLSSSYGAPSNRGKAIGMQKKLWNHAKMLYHMSKGVLIVRNLFFTNLDVTVNFVDSDGAGSCPTLQVLITLGFGNFGNFLQPPGCAFDSLSASADGNQCVPTSVPLPANGGAGVVVSITPLVGGCRITKKNFK